jgi:hypothetical protein
VIPNTRQFGSALIELSCWRDEVVAAAPIGLESLIGAVSSCRELEFRDD